MAGSISGEEFGKRLEDFEHKFLELFPKAIHASGLSAFELVKRRILKFGIDAKGNRLGSYSTAQIPLFYTKDGKVIAPYSSGALIKAAEDRVQKLVKTRGEKAVKKTLSYKEWREFNNLQVNFVDLKFSGDTWADIGVTAFEVQGTKVGVIISPLNKITRAKAANTEAITDSLYDKYGNFLELSQEEELVIDESVDADVTRLLQETLFAA